MHLIRTHVMDIQVSQTRFAAFALNVVVLWVPDGLPPFPSEITCLVTRLIPAANPRTPSPPLFCGEHIGSKKAQAND